MDPRLSPSLMEDLSLVSGNGFRQSIDDQTVCKTPFPLAASTVMRPRHGDKKRDYSFGDPRGSFINGGLSVVPSPHDEEVDKLSLGGNGESRKTDEMGCNDVSDRSSLGLIPADVLNDNELMFPESDLSSSGTLLNNFSKMRPSSDTRMFSTTNQNSPLSNRHTPSVHQASVNAQSTSDSNDWRDSSKQDSKNHAIGSSHVMDTVKKRPERDSVPGGRNNQQGAVAMSLFTGGLLGDVSEGGEMDASVHDIQFEADELQLLDEDFSDLEEALSTDDEEFVAQGFKDQKTLTDDDKLSVNKDNKEYEDGLMEDRHEAVGQESWNLDQKYFRVSPAVHMPEYRRESKRSKESYPQHQENRSNGGLNYLGRYCDGEGSEIETDDDMTEQNVPTLPSSSSIQQSHLRQAGLVGQSAPKLSYERQSGEGEVSGSPSSSVVGGTGLGDGSSGPESDDCNPRVPTSKTTPHKFAKPPMASHLDFFPGEERLRPMGNDLLSESHMRDRYLSSAMQSSLAKTDVDLNKFLVPTQSPQATYNQSLPQFDESSFQLEDILHDNESELGDHLEEERMEAFGYNASDLSKVDDPFSKFNSSMGSFGLDPNSTLNNDEISPSNQKIPDNSMSSYQKPEQEISHNHSQVLTNQKVTPKASIGRNQSNMSSKQNGSSPALSVLDTSTNKESNRRSGSVLHRSESIPKEKRKSESLSQSKQKLNISQGPVNRLSRTSSDTSVKPRKDTPMPPNPNKKPDDMFTKVPKPISAIGQPTKSSTVNLPKSNVKKHTTALPASKPTNLAFHSPFGEEAALQKELLSDLSDVHIDDNDFCSADAGLKMFDEDEKEFNKENIFNQHDNMSDSGETIQDAQWAYRSVMSQSQCTVQDDPWSRLSVGEYWAQGTENLGTLEGDPNLPRPEFGMEIRTPPNNRKPVALFKTTDGSPISQFGQNTPKTQDKSVVSDMTFTLSDLDTPQAERLKKLTSLSENTQAVSNSVNMSQLQHTATPNPKETGENISSLTNSLLNLEQSLSDQSGVLSVSAISSFINQISAQSDATELVNTIMALSKIKSKAKDSKVPESLPEGQQRQDTNLNNSPKEDSKANEMRRSKLPVRRGSNKELLEKSLKSRESKETPSPPVSRHASLQNKMVPQPTEQPKCPQNSTGNENLSDTYTDNDWKKYNQPDAHPALEVSNPSLTSPDRTQTSRSSSQWRSPRPSMGGRYCMAPNNQSRHNLDSTSALPKENPVEEQRNSLVQVKKKQQVPESDVLTNSNTGLKIDTSKISASQLSKDSEQALNQIDRMERSSKILADHQIMDENPESLSQSHRRVSDQTSRSVECHKSENDYSTRTNYFSPDREFTDTGDARLGDSRHFENSPTRVHGLRSSSCHSPPVQEKREDLVGLKKPMPSTFYHHDILVHEKPEKPTAISDNSPATHEFGEKYFAKEYEASGDDFKVPFPVKSSNNDPLPQESFCSDEVSFYELQAQNLSRLSHVMSESAPSFLSQAPSYQSTPFHGKRDGSFHSMTNMTPSYMKSVLSTGPINRHYANTDTTLLSHFDASGVPMATPKQMTQLDVPAIFTFPQFSCVGIALSANLPVFNPTSRWQECILHVQHLRVNNQPVDPEKYSPFQMKSKVIIEPNSTEAISVMFLPRIPGAFVAKLQIYAKPFLRDVVVASNRIPVEVTMQAISESPNVQVVTATDDQMIHFGQLTWGACRTSSLQLRNLNKGSVPVRLTIANSKSSWQCFSFDKETASSPHQSYSKSSRPTSPVFGKNAMSLCLEGYTDRPATSVEEIKIYCIPPHKESDRALSLRPPEIFEARIDVEIDTDVPNIPPITSVVLRAEVGVAKLHTPVDLDKIFLSTTWGKKCSKSFKLKNAGNINMEVSFFVPQFSDIFPVSPRFLKIPAGQDRQLTVEFEPLDKNVCNYDSLLLMGLEPDGPTYELPLKGELKQAVAPPAGPLLLSDKHSLPFGGVALGRAKQLRVTLKSNAHQALKLRVEIRSSSNAFQFQMSSMPTETSCQYRDVIIQPQEKFPIYVVYSPTQVESHNGKLVIKPYDCNAKFSISLSGYGGVSCVTLDDVNQSGTTRFWIDVGEITLNKSSMLKVAVTNTGHRAAFVKALSFTDLQLKQTLPPGRIAVDPNEFILCPKETKMVHVAFCPSDRELAACYREKDVVASVAFYHGDEVSRQKYRRAVNKPVKSGKRSQKVSVELPIQKVNFDVSYKGDSGDKVVTEGNGINETDSDVDLFYTNLSHVSLALIGHPVTKLDTCTPQVYPKSRRSQGSHKPVDRTETLPLPGSKRSSCPSDNRLAYTSHHPGEKDCDWSVLPQQLICSVSRDGRKTQSNSFQIVNFSTRDIKYELSWPGHWFSVSPEQGTIKPKSHIMVTLCPLTNLQVSKLPWSGAVVVCCDEQFSEVKVQIKCEPTYEADAKTYDKSSGLVPVPNQATDTSSKCKDIEKYLDVPSTHFIFPKTRIGDHSGKTMEFTNKSNSTLSWSISSFAPAYAKGIENTSDVYRVTYSAFVVKEKTGQLLPNETAEVPIMFVPRSGGTFTQYWDLQCYLRPSVSDNSMTVRISLVGEAYKESEEKSHGLDTTNNSCDTSLERPVTIKETLVNFSSIEGMSGSVVKIALQNESDQPCNIKVVAPKPPFYIKHQRFSIGRRRFLKYPIEFKPEGVGIYQGMIIFRTDLGYDLNVQLHGDCQIDASQNTGLQKSYSESVV